MDYGKRYLIFPSVDEMKKKTIAELAISKGSNKKLDTEISDLEHLG